MIKAILFDFNGVIINDERIHLRAYREVLKAEGIELSDEDYFASLGMDDIAFVRAAYGRAARALTDETAREIIDQEHSLHRKLISEDLPVSTGVISFVKSAARRYDLAMVSMAERSEIEHVLAMASLDKCFSIIVSATPGLKHKPAPDCYLLALKSLNERRRANRQLPLVARECLAIEDAPPGIAAACAAGMRTIGITNTVSEGELRTAGAEVVTANLSDWNTEAVHHLFD